jgi:hypothetical protein
LATVNHGSFVSSATTFDGGVCGPWHETQVIVRLWSAFVLFGSGVMMALLDLLVFWALLLTAAGMLSNGGLTAPALELVRPQRSQLSPKIRV